MSNWITITIADLYNSKVAPLITAADTTALAAGQTGRVAGVISDVTLEIRRKVARVNVLDQDTTKIPGGLKTLAVDIIFCRLKVGLEMELSAPEAETLKRREKDLDRVADGKDFIDPPDNPITVNMEQAQPAPAFGRPRRIRQNELEG